MRRNIQISLLAVMSVVLTSLLGGCGSGNREGASIGFTKVDEATCAQCHGASYSSQSGVKIYSEYVKSKHFKNSVGTVVGCQDCHGGGSAHNGIGPLPYPNPDAAGKCFGCHKNEFLGLYNANKNPSAIQQAHFWNITGAGVHNAMFATKNFQNVCTACHEPHNPLLGLGAAERQAWMSEGHGDITSTAFATEDFKQNTSCIRCHTSTGYSNFLAGKTGGPTGAWSDPFPANTWATPGDNGREVLTCRTCHNNDSFSVKSAPAFVAPYNNNKNTKTFPNVGESNLCIACHSARESGDTITTFTGNFANTSFKNSHYKASAATMYMANAFINFTSLTAPAPSNNEGSPFTSSKSYAQTLLPDNKSVPTYGVSGGQSSSHRRLGTPLIAGSEDYLPAGGTALTQNGPCVTCHLDAYNPVPGVTGFGTPLVRPAHGHSWEIGADAATQLCLPCHADAPHLDGGDGAGHAHYTTMTSIDDLYAVMIGPQSEAFQNGLTLVKQLLVVKYMINFDDTTYPYFYDLQTNKAVTDWTRKSVAGVTDAASIALGLAPIPAGGFNQKQAMRLMGACFNLNLLDREPGAYLHARTFSQRLVYDIVDFLDDNMMNFTALTTARSLTAAGLPGLTGVYVGTNVNVFASDGTLATESMAWLTGTHYTDNDGAKPVAHSLAGTNTLMPLKLRP